MPAISFSTMKEKIRRGLKKQTIRPKLSDYWMCFKKGDRLVGYWKLRQGGEKLFDSEFSEDPFTVMWRNFTDELMQRDGFIGKYHADVAWFKPFYGLKRRFDDITFHEVIGDKEFVVIRWK